MENADLARKDEKPPSRSFPQLVVWQKAHAWVLDMYRMTNGFPKIEMYGLTSQMRRSAVSVPANIAEGFKKRGKADKVRFFNMAQGSLEESKYYLILSQDLGYADTKGLLAQADEVARLLGAYIRGIEAGSRPPDSRLLTSGF